MTMRFGLSGRVEPLLDHRLAEFAFACPLRFRMGSLGAKHLLRSVLYDLVLTIDRSPQAGFRDSSGLVDAGRTDASTFTCASF